MFKRYITQLCYIQQEEHALLICPQIVSIMVVYEKIILYFNLNFLAKARLKKPERMTTQSLSTRDLIVILNIEIWIGYKTSENVKISDPWILRLMAIEPTRKCKRSFSSNRKVMKKKWLFCLHELEHDTFTLVVDQKEVEQ